MSSDARAGSGWQRWRAPVTGAVAGLAVAAAIVGPAALADSGGNAGASAKAKAAGAPGNAAPHVVKQRGTPAPGGVPHQFTDAIAQLVQAGTINAAQGRALDAQIETGSMDPQQMVSRGVLTSAQMAAVNERLVAIKKSLAASQPRPVSPAAAAAACGKGAGQPPAA